MSKKHQPAKAILITILILISFNSFGQRFEYSLGGGGNYSYFSNVSADTKDGFGFSVNNGLTFSLNKYFSIKTGLGISMLNVNYTSGKTAEMTYFSGTTIDSLYYNDREPFIIPGSVIPISDSSYTENTHIIPIGENMYNNYWDNGSTIMPHTSFYKLFLLNVPLQLQVGLFKNKILLSPGFSVSTIIYAKNKLTINQETYEYIANDDFNNFICNLNMGIKYNVYKNIYAGIQYERSITSLKGNANNFIDPEITLTNINSLNLNNISFSISYKF